MVRISGRDRHIDDILWEIDQALAQSERLDWRTTTEAAETSRSFRGALSTSGLDKTAANYAALSPVSFDERSAEVFGDLPAVIHGRRRATWRQLRDRSDAACGVHCERSASSASDDGQRDAADTPEMVEAHYAVPALNAVLNTLNTRLDAPLLAWQMNHCEPRC
jgi:fatty-acyl-CoA synthase